MHDRSLLSCYFFFKAHRPSPASARHPLSFLARRERCAAFNLVKRPIYALMRSAFCSAAVYSVLHFAAQQLCAFCNLQRSSVLQFAAPLRHIARVRVSVPRAASTAFCILQRCALAAVVHLSRWNGGMRRPAPLGTNNAVSSIALKMKSFMSSSVFHLSWVSCCEVHAVIEVYGKWMKETKADDTTRLNLGVHDRSLLSFHLFFKDLCRVLVV